MKIQDSRILVTTRGLAFFVIKPQQRRDFGRVIQSPRKTQHACAQEMKGVHELLTIHTKEISGVTLRTNRLFADGNVERRQRLCRKHRYRLWQGNDFSGFANTGAHFFWDPELPPQKAEQRIKRSAQNNGENRTKDAWEKEVFAEHGKTWLPTATNPLPIIEPVKRTTCTARHLTVAR